MAKLGPKILEENRVECQGLDGIEIYVQQRRDGTHGQHGRDEPRHHRCFARHDDPLRRRRDLHVRGQRPEFVVGGAERRQQPNRRRVLGDRLPLAKQHQVVDLGALEVDRSGQRLRLNAHARARGRAPAREPLSDGRHPRHRPAAQAPRRRGHVRGARRDLQGAPVRQLRTARVANGAGLSVGRYASVALLIGQPVFP